MRIGILKTDSVRDEFQSEFGDYPAMFRAVLMASADDEPIEFRDYDVQRGEYPATIDECDAYLITGSRESVYDDQPWIHRLGEFVRQLDAARHKLVGHLLRPPIDRPCARRRNPRGRCGLGGWRAGDPGADAGRMDAAVSRALRSAVEPQRSGRAAAGAGANCSPRRRTCPNSGFTIGEHILTFQGHPEFSKGYSHALMDLRRELCSASRLQQRRRVARQSRCTSRWSGGGSSTSSASARPNDTAEVIVIGTGRLANGFARLRGFRCPAAARRGAGRVRRCVGDRLRRQDRVQQPRPSDQMVDGRLHGARPGAGGVFPAANSRRCCTGIARRSCRSMQGDPAISMRELADGATVEEMFVFRRKWKPGGISILEASCRCRRS